MKRIALALVAALALLSTGAKADTLRTFAIEDRSGLFLDDGAHNIHSVLSGLITVDTSTGEGLYGYIQYDLYQSGLGQPFNPPLTMKILSNATNYSCIPAFHCLDYPNTHVMEFQTTQGATSLEAWISTPTSLVGYMGGNLCYMPGCDPEAYTYFAYQNFSFPPYTIGGTPYPGGTISDVDVFNLNAKLVLVSEVTTPEPATWVLLGSGALGLLGTMKRRLQQS